MANIKSAKKQAKQDIFRTKVNLTRKTALKTAVKKVMVALEKKEDMAKVLELFNDAQAKLARAKGKGLLHRNTAARKVSRLALRVNAAKK